MLVLVNVSGLCYFNVIMSVDLEMGKEVGEERENQGAGVGRMGFESCL